MLRMEFQAWQAFCKIANKGHVVTLLTESHTCDQCTSEQMQACVQACACDCMPLATKPACITSKRKLLRLFQKILLMIYGTLARRRKKSHFFLYLMPLQRKQHYPFANVDFLNSPSITVKLHVILKRTYKYGKVNINVSQQYSYQGGYE